VVISRKRCQITSLLPKSGIWSIK